MESKNQTTSRRQGDSSQDVGASIVVGGILCLAAYGLYKLTRQEPAPPPPLPHGPETDLARLVSLLESKS